MNYFLISTIIFFTLFIIVLTFFIVFKRRLGLKIQEIENKNSELSLKTQYLISIERECHLLLETVIDSIPHGIVILDKDLKAVKINESISNLFYLDRKKLMGEKTIFIFNNKNLEDLVEESLSENKPSRRDIVFYGDEEIALSVDAKPLGLENYHLMLIFNNTTQEVEFSRLRSQFVSNVSHEMRTPLTSIKGYIETLLENKTAAQDITARYLSKTLEEVERLNILIEDVLNLSNIEYRRNVLFKKEINIIEIVNDCIDSLSFIAEKNGVKIEFIFNKNPVLLKTEEEIFRQVIRNLIENAIFHGGNNILISINIIEKDEEIEIIIEDNGKGIENADLPFIFQRFYRGKSTYPYLRTGSGLGLSIVKHIMELHGGKVEALSQPGIKTRFVLTFPK